MGLMRRNGLRSRRISSAGRTGREGTMGFRGRALSKLGLGTLLAILASACGGGADIDLPAPPQGMATVGGRVTLNGNPAPAVSVNLQGATGGGQPTEIDTATETDADGTFVFDSVVPGFYWLIIKVSVEASPEVVGEAIGEDLLVTRFNDPCHADGYHVSNNAEWDESVLDISEAPPIGIAAFVTCGGPGEPTCEEQGFEVGEGDRIANEIAFECDLPLESS